VTVVKRDSEDFARAARLGGVTEINVAVDLGVVKDRGVEFCGFSRDVIIKPDKRGDF